MRQLLLLIVLSASAAIAQDKQADSIENLDQIRRTAQRPIDDGSVTAISVGVVQGDGVWTGHFGKLSGEDRQPPDDETLYEVGSISKVFTGILLAHAVKSGQLTLDQTIGSIVPEIQQNNPSVGSSIKLIHLSTHYSGLPRMPGNWNPERRNEPYVDYDRTLLIECLSKVKPPRKPNRTKSYSNLGVGLLGDLLAIKAGTSYETLLRTKITEPLELNNTVVKLNDDRRQRLAPPHRHAFLGIGLIRDTPWEFDALAGAGGIRSTTTDMIRFMQAMINPPDSILGEAIDLAWSEQIAKKANASAMGLGWHVARDGSTRQHGGRTGGYTSMMRVNREKQMGVIVLCNTSSGHTSQLGTEIFETLVAKPPNAP